MSISTAKLLQERTLEFCRTIKNWQPNGELFEKVNEILKKEYHMIPEKERIGKGIKFISNHVAKGVFEYQFNKKKANISFIVELVETSFSYGEKA